MIQRITISIPVNDTNEANENSKIITEMLNKLDFQYVYSHLVLTEEQYYKNEE